MIRKKKIILFMSVLLAVGLLFGCGKKEEETEEKQRLIFTVNGYDVYEDDFKYIAEQYKNEVETYYGTISDWTSELESGISYEDYVISMTENWFKYAESIKSQSIRLNLELTEEDEKVLEEQWETACEDNGGEEQLLATMTENGLSKEFNDYITQVSYLADKCFANMYGENGEKVTDEECAEKTADDGYLMAKHILLLTSSTDEDGNTTEYAETEKEAVKKRAENILSLLEECSTEQVEEKFDELMNNNTEDTGIEDYPNGYLFTSSDVAEEFYEAASALEVGQYSGIVETEYGYHIILRIAVDYDVIPMAYAGYADYGYDYYTLRYLVANDMFSANISSWIERTEVTNTEVLDSLSMESLIAVG
jgi:hypothetical protein